MNGKEDKPNDAVIFSAESEKTGRVLLERTVWFTDNHR